MEAARLCPECRAAWTDERTCQDDFYRMLAWESENPSYIPQVHHLMVLCYHLQHPSLYSPEVLTWAKQLLVDFLERGVTTEAVRRRDRAALDSGKRKFKIKGTPASHGAYDPAVEWTVTAADVTAGDVEDYCDSVRAWARSILAAFRASGNVL